MLSRLPTQTDDGGCGLEAESPAPAFSLADEDSSHAGVFPSVLPQSFASLPHPPPPPSAPCCSCVSLLPRLLAVHRLEVRRLLRGALASLGRRLDSLERRSKRNGRKKKRRKQREGGEGVPTFNCSSASSSKPTLSPVRVSSFSSDSNKPPPSSFSQSEQTISREREVSRRKKRRKNHKEFNLSDIEENNNEEEEGGRFVGQMAVSFRGRGAEEEESLILSDFSQKKRKRDEERSIHPEKAVGVMVRRNGYSYVRRLTSSSPISAWRQQKQQTNQSAQSLHRRRVLPLPLCPANGLSDALPTDQSATVSKFLHTDVKLGKRVSQIRIRRASPREMSLTPMGLPKVKRLKKKEFSLEEIYTNKNYESPPNNRSLETIFEEPREKDGAQLLIGQQKRRRLLLFSDFTQPRKRKRPQCVGLAVATVPRKRAAARRHILSDGLDDRSDLDVMLVERLSALEDFLIEQALDV